ncbi:uncharacterized protein [Antedon mediterranea]|uniref:uncharacterized protein n=1 Tax=Antedon mediterranea TaxID=105859 RepID=UPI003AF9F633
MQLVRLTVLSLMVALVVSNSHTVERGDCHVSVVFNDCERHPRDCTDILDRDSQAKSGEYTIDPHDGGKPIRVDCDMVTDGGGWTVFQRREDGRTDFYRNWAAYKTGFGKLNTEHWLGNDNIYRITSAGHFELRIDMTTFDNESAYARYGTFRIGNEGTNYKLMIGTYTGDAGDSLTYHNNFQFSTFDRDNDNSSGSPCAVTYKGAWWYDSCHWSNLNGLYMNGPIKEYANGVIWQTWKSYYYSLKTTEMKIRRLKYAQPHIIRLNPFPGSAFIYTIVSPDLLHLFSGFSLNNIQLVKMFVRSIILSLMVALVVSSSHTVDRDDCHVSVVVNDCEKHARDCTDILERDSQAQSGEYTIDPHDGGKPIRVYCDMVTDGGGWTVFQRRENGTTDFYRGWAAYKTGFGSINSEHWLGNDNIYRITSAGHFELRIDMTTFDNESAYARYGTFRIGNECTNYKLMIGTYTGDAGDSLSFHNNQQFSTSDRDNDVYSDKSCAVQYKGAWWYAKCHASNLNGLYLGGNTKEYATGVVWKTWKTHYYSLKTTEMKIRRLK